MRNYLQANTVVLYLEYFMHTLGLQHYSTNSLLYLRITQLHTYVSAIRILAKGYLLNTLIKPAKMQEILSEVKKSLQITNPDYNLVLEGYIYTMICSLEPLVLTKILIFLYNSWCLYNHTLRNL